MHRTPTIDLRHFRIGQLEAVQFGVLLDMVGIAGAGDELEPFLPQVTVTPALVQNEIHPYYQENDVIPYIQDLGIVVQGWYPSSMASRMAWPTSSSLP